MNKRVGSKEISRAEETRGQNAQFSWPQLVTDVAKQWNTITASVSANSLDRTQGERIDQRKIHPKLAGYGYGIDLHLRVAELLLKYWGP